MKFRTINNGDVLLAKMLQESEATSTEDESECYISIHDRHVEWIYPVRLSTDLSIDSIATKIWGALGVEKPQGHIRTEYDSDESD